MTDDRFEVKTLTPQEVLNSMVDELHMGSCLLPLPDEFLQHLRDEHDEVDPETSMTFFYMQIVRPSGDTDLLMCTAIEAMQIHEATAKYIQGMIESLEDQ